MSTPPAHDRPSPALRVVGLTAGYRDRPALRRVSLEVAAGERVAVLGPNGAGKSTLLKCVVGLLPPWAGRVEVEGLTSRPARRRVAYLPQRAEIDWDHPARVRDVVAMGRYPHRGPVGWLRAHDRAEVAAAIARVGLEDLADTRISELSGGQQQRTFLARALAQRAALLLLDEPFAGLDATTAGLLDRELAAAVAEGMAVLVVNHDLAGLRAGHDRLVALNQRVVADGTPSHVLTPSVLEATYGATTVVPAGGGAS